MADLLRVVFLGTGDIALPSLGHLLSDPDVAVVALVTQPDKPAGRHKLLKTPHIKEAARAAGVEVLQPAKARDAIPRLVELAADLFVVMAYGQLLPQRLLDLPRLACWNLHASLLPRHRGASPIQAALRAGDAETGVSVMHVARELDAGDIVLAERTPIRPGETGGQLHDRLAELAPLALAKALACLRTGAVPRTPQDPSLVTYLGKLTREHGRIDWNLPATALERAIRAYDPWPSSFTSLPDGRPLKVFPPTVVVEAGAVPGTVLAAGPGGIVVACGRDALRLTFVQPEGRRHMTTDEFLRGHALAVGARLGANDQ